MAAGAASIFVATYICTCAAGETVRSECCSPGWPYPGAFTRQSLGAGMGKYFPVNGSFAIRQELRHDRAAQSKESRCQGNGEVRRRLLHLVRVCSAPGNLLGAVAVHQTR